MAKPILCRGEPWHARGRINQIWSSIKRSYKSRWTVRDIQRELRSHDIRITCRGLLIWIEKGILKASRFKNRYVINKTDLLCGINYFYEIVCQDDHDNKRISHIPKTVEDRFRDTDLIDF